MQKYKLNYGIIHNERDKIQTFYLKENYKILDDTNIRELSKSSQEENILWIKKHWSHKNDKWYSITKHSRIALNVSKP